MKERIRELMIAHEYMRYQAENHYYIIPHTVLQQVYNMDELENNLPAFVDRIERMTEALRVKSESDPRFKSEYDTLYHIVHMKEFKRLKEEQPNYPKPIY